MSQGEQSIEEQIEKLDQEITLRLQSIDSNLDYSFKKITQDIIPHVRNYSTICDAIIDSTACLTTIFQQSGNLNLSPETVEQTSETNDKKEDDNEKQVADSIFPTRNSASSSSNDNNQSTVHPEDNIMETSQDFHTANITSTGQILKLPDSSDEEDNPGKDVDTTNELNNFDEDGNDSTMQRQSRKRKISLLLQQQYGSSSSALPSPVPISGKNKKQVKTYHNDDGESSGINSSPLRKDESTKDLLNVDESNNAKD